MDRSYYSQRAGRGPASATLGLQDLKRIFKAQFDQLESEGYFQEYLGFQCVDAGFVPGSIGTDLEAELLLTLRKPNLWPVHSTIDDWSEDDLFDMVEFLYDHISKPTKRHFHDYSGCGWHCSEFDRDAGRLEYRQKINRLLEPMILASRCRSKERFLRCRQRVLSRFWTLPFLTPIPKT